MHLSIISIRNQETSMFPLQNKIEKNFYYENLRYLFFLILFYFVFFFKKKKKKKIRMIIVKDINFAE